MLIGTDVKASPIGSGSAPAYGHLFFPSVRERIRAALEETWDGELERFLDLAGRVSAVLTEPWDTRTRAVAKRLSRPGSDAVCRAWRRGTNGNMRANRRLDNRAVSVGLVVVGVALALAVAVAFDSPTSVYLLAGLAALAVGIAVTTSRH